MASLLPHKDLVNLPKDFTLVVNTSDPHKHLHSYELIDWLPTEGICLLLNRTSYNLKNMLNILGFDTHKLYFIDTISKRIDSKLKTDRTYYLHTNKDLNQISNSIEKVSSLMPSGDKFIIIDSLHNLLMHHDEKTSLNFLDFINQRLRLLRLNRIYLTDFNKLKPSIKNKLLKISDRIIHL